MVDRWRGSLIRPGRCGTKPGSVPYCTIKLRAFADTWQGTLHAGKSLRTVVKIAKADGGGYKAVFYSIDQGGDGLPVDSVTLDGTMVKMTLKMIGGTYEGKLSGDGKTVTGSWSPGPPRSRSTSLAPPPRPSGPSPRRSPVPPMAADANPSFDVATIKPSKPDAKGKGFGFRGGHFVTFNTNVNDLIAFAYSLHSKQIVGALRLVRHRPVPTSKPSPMPKVARSLKQWRNHGAEAPHRALPI